MVYSVEEKSRIDGLLSVFGDYIKGHSAFDIVYSEKIGYFKINIIELDMPLIEIGSYESMLETLFNEVANDIWVQQLDGPHHDLGLSLREQLAVRKQLKPFIDNMGEDKAFAEGFLESFLLNFGN